MNDAPGLTGGHSEVSDLVLHFKILSKHDDRPRHSNPDILLRPNEMYSGPSAFSHNGATGAGLRSHLNY